ncbi:ABC transporter substrate-binding protein [Campylobacter canadensis]|uniref:Tgt2/MlaC family protein n=1 Tax=Campylobacter canadensis TaxID=449520 RepID=UPI001555782D|nr:ABC transporter substrate-binding protein [Campylobacter canadensis]
MKFLAIFVFLSTMLFAYNIKTFSTDYENDINKITKILQQKDLNNKDELIFNVLKDKLDEELMLRLVLSSNYNLLSEEKKNEFKNLFFKKLQDDFLSKINLLQADSIKFLDAYIDEKKCIAKVSAKYDDKMQEAVFNFRKIKDDCKIYDIAVLGTSLIASYRAQFLDIINQDGIDKLFEKLR